MPMVKEDDAMPVVNQDEASVDPFGDRDDWAVGIMSKAFLKIRHVLQNMVWAPSTRLGRKR